VKECDGPCGEVLALPHLPSPLLSPSNLPYSLPATILPSPLLPPLLPSLLPTSIPSYPLHTPLLSLPIYLSVRRERERERERELMREGDHLLHSVVVGGCTALISHIASYLPVLPTLLDCRIPAPPTLPQFSFAPGESSDVYSASSAGELTGGTLSVDSESSRFFPFSQ
jgi:hypothetical protein